MFAMIDPEDRERVRSIFESAIKNGTAFNPKVATRFPMDAFELSLMRGLPLLDEA